MWEAPGMYQVVVVGVKPSKFALLKINYGIFLRVFFVSGRATFTPDVPLGSRIEKYIAKWDNV
jgi:hypothetical protein